jgi:aspartyl aminopeptidase
MNDTSFNQGLMNFIRNSPTPFHAVSEVATILDAANFERIKESQHWQLEKDKAYYTIRNDSAIIAFKTGVHKLVGTGIHLTGAHTDSPCLKVKPIPEITGKGYVQLGVEIYGGALLHPWFDRDLSLAGRVEYLAKDGALYSCLVNLVDPIAFIPSLAIHLDRSANTGRKINAQKELPPVLLQVKESEEFELDSFLLEHLKNKLGLVDATKVLSHELAFYDSQPPSLIGLEQQFIAAARLDNLLSCYIAVCALVKSKDEYSSLLVCNDHEEVGSSSTAGAQGPFLNSVLERIVGAKAEHADDFERVIRQSLLLSIDNAHGVHPNFSDKHDDQHGPILNGGPVIKINANQRYASSSNSIARFKSLCENLGVSYQPFVMRSDMACGSTIGPLTATRIGVSTVDIGVPTLGMHSIRELAGVDDAEALCRVVTAFYTR